MILAAFALGLCAPAVWYAAMYVAASYIMGEYQ